MSDVTLSDSFYQEAQSLLYKRLSTKRFKHSVSVARTAVKLARVYDVDEDKARIAGLLHDWDKGYDDEGIRKRVDELGMSVDPILYTKMPRLLHSLTASEALKREFPTLDDDVLQAIARHTSGEVDMTPLDMVIYVADAIEPLRNYQSEENLYEKIGTMSLEDLFLATYKQVFSYLISKERQVHPDTIRIWNSYIERRRKGRTKKGSMC